MELIAESIKNPISGVVRLPGDKSISHRALILGAIASGKTTIQGCLKSDDVLRTLKALTQLGVSITEKNGIITIEGVGVKGLKASSAPLDFGNSGTGLRLMAGVLASQAFDSTLLGDASLNHRPMGRIIDPLTRMGAKVCGERNGETICPPLKITGAQNLHGICYAPPVASAQIKSAVLLAGLFAKGDTVVQEIGPSRDHTEIMLQSFGCPLQINEDGIRLIGGHKLMGCHLQIPGDISSSAFFMVAACIKKGSELCFRDLGINPRRTAIIDLLRLMGAHIELRNERNWGGEALADVVVKSSPLKGIDIPFNKVVGAIDDFPALFIAAAVAKGTTTLHGAKELRVKESDRIESMALGLKHMGVKLKVFEDGIEIEGGALQGAQVNAFGDHRVAMAFAIASVVTPKAVIIHQAEGIDTSFPNFINVANAMGFIMTKELGSTV